MIKNIIIIVLAAGWVVFGFLALLDYKGDREKDPFGGSFDLMGSPGMEEQMREQSKKLFDLRYGGYLDQMAFSDEKREQVRALLDESTLMSHKESRQFLKMSEKEQVKWAEKMNVTRKEREAALADLLSEPEREALELWKEQAPKRQMLMRLMLGPKETQVLVDHMIRRDEEMAKKRRDELRSVSASGTSSEKISRKDAYVERQRKLYELYLQDAESVLDEQRLKAFKEDLARRLESTEKNWEISNKMIRGVLKDL